MKKKWKVWNWICFLGIPWLPIFSAFGIFLKAWWQENYGRGRFRLDSIEDIKGILALAAVGWMIVLLRNSLHLRDQEPVGMLTWLDKYRYEPADESVRKRKAQYPPVPEEYLTKTLPGDKLILGKQAGKYVCYPWLTPGRASGALILGAPGSGKSTMLKTSLCSFWQEWKDKEDRPAMLLYDIKPELMESMVLPQDECMRKLAFERSAWGFDLLYAITDETSQDKILSALGILGDILFDAPDPKAAFFYDSAKNIFLGIGLFTILEDRKKGKSPSFMRIIHVIMDKPLIEVVQDVIDQVRGRPDRAKVWNLLNAFDGKEDDDGAFSSISMTEREKLSVFSRDDVMWFLGDNPRKVSPQTLEEGFSIAFCVRSADLSEYSLILTLVCAVVLHHIEARPDRTGRMILLVLDELARIAGAGAASENGTALGRMILSTLAVSRSKNAFILGLLQGRTQIANFVGKHRIDELFELLSVIGVLSCASPETAKMICDYCSDYSEEKISENRGGKNDGTYSRSFEQKKILQPADLMELREKKELVLFFEGKYLRVKTSPFYEIPSVLKYSESCVAAHKAAKQK